MKGKLKDCYKCILQKIKRECELSKNEIEEVEIEKGMCLYFCPKRVKK